MSARPQPKTRFVDLSARDFERKFDERRPKFAVNHHDESIRNVIPLRTGDLEADGCAFVAALDWLMTFAGYDELPRSFVRAVAGAVERDEKGKGRETSLSDEQLAEAMGCSTKTVQRQRKAYLKQEQARNFSVLRITEGNFDKDVKKNVTTRYEFLIGPQAAQTVERARTSPRWKRDQRAAMREAAREVFDDIPTAPLATRKRKKRTLPADREAQKIRAQIVSLARRLGEQVLKISDPELREKFDLDALQRDVANAVRSADLRQVLVNVGDDQTGGQNVHPSEGAESVHTRTEAVWTSPPDTPAPDPAASAAWETLRSRFRPPAETIASQTVVTVEEHTSSPDDLPCDPNREESIESVAVADETCLPARSSDEPSTLDLTAELFDEHGDFHLPVGVRATDQQIKEARKKVQLE